MPEMKIKKGQEQVYQDWYDKNPDPYGNACFRYANNWAFILESKIKSGQKITKEIIEQVSHDADTEEITGFMFGVAKSILINCWEYGHMIEYYYTNDENKKKILERQLKLERILK